MSPRPNDDVEFDGGIHLGQPLVEGIARVVDRQGRQVWLEPEQTTSCGGCSTAGLCEQKGIGSLASRLERRRFRLDDAAELAVGERVVVGVSELALVKAASVAYALPLVTALMAGGLAQWLAGSDAISLVAAVGGLIAGLILARLTASRLGRSGQLAPRFLRRLDPPPPAWDGE